jgi:hypothetical protein
MELFSLINVDQTRPDQTIPTFVITQKEKEILLHNKKVLGFGIVREYKSFSRYFVLDKQNIYLLTLLFNGNLVLEHRKSQLSY